MNNSLLNGIRLYNISACTFTSDSGFILPSSGFDGQNYRLQEFWKGGQKPHMKMTSLEKAIMETDEKVGLIPSAGRLLFSACTTVTTAMSNHTNIPPFRSNGCLSNLRNSPLRPTSIHNMEIPSKIYPAYVTPIPHGS